MINILGSILTQLCGSPDSYAKIKSIYDQKSTKSFGKLEKMNADQSVPLIIERIREQGQAFIFVDAVNECSNPEEVINPLKTIANSCENVHMFFSSINEKGIDDSLQQMPRLMIRALDPWHMMDDIHMLVQANLETHSRLRHHTPQLKDEITQALTRGAQGM